MTMMKTSGLKWNGIGLVIILSLFLYGGVSGQGAPGVDTTELRVTEPLMDNWKFVQDDTLSDREALESTGEDWQTVSLPHTWNAEDAASLDATTYKRGIGWYRLEFNMPAAGARHWLEFGAASLVADVWLNGIKLGEHRGGFTAFRFDITDELSESGPNVLLVKTNNSAPNEKEDATAIAPLGGDFNVSGGLYRYVSLVSTVDPVHFDLGDMGGPGVYATTTAISGGNATINVRTKLKSDSNTNGDYIVRLSLLDAEGQLAGSVEQPVSLTAGSNLEVAQDLNVSNAHLWQGIEDPYLYLLVAELLTTDGVPIDKVVQKFGIRQMRFDANEGFFLNGQQIRLHGVAMHQDYLGKGWAISSSDMDKSLGLIMEVGANAVRFGHYPFSQYAHARASELGLVVWAETALGLGTTVDSCSTTDPTEAFVANAKQQLQEMIRQQYNHASVAMWSVGNETSARQLNCPDPYDNVTPVLRELHEVAKSEDPSRPTAYAEFGHPVERSGPYATEGITDVFATNRYFLWYTPEFELMGPLLDGLHALTPNQPFGVSEYGAGAALTHHTDNPRSGYPNVRSAPEGEVSYQPEEYAAYAHEQNYRLISSKPYLWGSFVWNMFDFGSAHRNEGDVLGVNTKGLVTFDRQIKKDPFFFYKANWSKEPVTYIVGRRYTDRAYAVNDVKVYSNANSVRLLVNNVEVGSMTANQCEFRTCVFQDVRLGPGTNRVAAVGDHGGSSVTDSVVWFLNNSDDVSIAAGRLATGYVSSQETRFGSDSFFSGGTFAQLAPPGGQVGPESLGGADTPQIDGTDDPQLYKYFRRGDFSYEIPLDNGEYEVTLGFIEFDEDAQVGERVFNVTANGETQLEDFDILEEVGDPRTVVTRNFTVEVTNGLLRLEFTPTDGKDAVVSTIKIIRQ
jgi:beta-galactosidase